MCLPTAMPGVRTLLFHLRQAPTSVPGDEDSGGDGRDSKGCRGSLLHLISSGDDRVSSDSNLDFHDSDQSREFDCKIISEFFTSNRNVQATLDEHSVHVKISLVVGILSRSQHIHKPAHRFFREAVFCSDFEHESETYNSLLRGLSYVQEEQGWAFRKKSSAPYAE